MLVKGERIVGVGPRGSLDGGQAEIVEIGGTLLPGLVNLHVHLHSGGGSTPDPAADEPTAGDAFALLRCARNARFAIRWGCTSVRDAGTRETWAQTTRDAIAAGLIVGPRVWASGRVITTSAPEHAAKRGRIADGAAELERAVRECVADGADAIKIYATSGGGGHTPASLPQYTAEELGAAVREAHRARKRVLAHCNGSLGTRNAVHAGVDTIEHLGWMGPDGAVDFDTPTCEEMIRKDITVVPTMAVWFGPVYEDAAMSSDRRRTLAARPARTAAWTAMHRMGVRFAAGTDTWDPPQRELELMVAEMGLSPLEAIVAGTRNGAIALGAGADVGTIEAGRYADLLVVDGDPLADIADLRRVSHVWKGGALLVEHGRPTA